MLCHNIAAAKSFPGIQAENIPWLRNQPPAQIHTAHNPLRLVLLSMNPYHRRRRGQQHRSGRCKHPGANVNPSVVAKIPNSNE